MWSKKSNQKECALFVMVSAPNWRAETLLWQHPSKHSYSKFCCHKNGTNFANVSLIWHVLLWSGNQSLEAILLQRSIKELKMLYKRRQFPFISRCGRRGRDYGYLSSQGHSWRQSSEPEPTPAVPPRHLTSGQGRKRLWDIWGMTGGNCLAHSEKQDQRHI